MLASHLILALTWAIGLELVVASLVPLNSNLQIRNAPGMSSSETVLAIRRAISSVAIMKRETVFKNSSTISKSWDSAVLFSNQAGTQISCTTCYVKGTATAQFTVDGNFNASQAFYNVASAVKNETDYIISTTIDYVESFFANLTVNDLTHIGDLTLPPIHIDFDVDIPDIPSSELRFQFDGMELYMQFETTLSVGSTYTINLFTSETPIGLSVGKDLLIGVVFSVDLILSAESTIDISNGFHILLNDGIVIDIPMFSQNVSSVTFNGGQFEFLPVTIQSPNCVLTAVLRVGIKAGVELSTPTKNDFQFSAGIEAGIWADVAQFKTNVTTSSTNTNSICELHVIEEYSMLLGANVGATIAIDQHTWGPNPTFQTPIWYTTIFDACAVSGNVNSTATTTAAATLAPRADLTTKTTTTTVTYTATVCLSTGLVNCPASLQSTSKYKVTSTLTTAIPSGSKPTFPATTHDSVTSTVAFGTLIQKLIATSGNPVSYIPKASETSNSNFTGGGYINTKPIIGVCVGVGVLILITAGCILYFKLKKKAPVQTVEPTNIRLTYLEEQDSHTPVADTPKFYIPRKKLPDYTVVETPRDY